MSYRKHTLTLTSALSLCILFTSYSLIRVSSESLPVQNPHALNLQQRYNNELDNFGKARRGGSESNGGGGSDGESVGQLVSNVREILESRNLRDSINFLSPVLQFPTRFLYESIFSYSDPNLIRFGQIGGQEKEKLFQRFLWEANKGKYLLPALLKVLNHPNGLRIKSEDVASNNPRSGLFEYDDRRDNNPVGDLNQLTRSSNEAKGTLNLDSPSANSMNDMAAQKRNNNAGFICHFKLCQLGASGKRRFNPGGGWNFKGDHDYD